VAGLTDLLGSAGIRSLRLVWWHFLGNAVALVLTAISLWLRLAAAETTVTSGELILSLLVVLIFAVTGWLGGELVFRHGAGAMVDEMPAPAEIREPPRRAA
jgi:uncharacterized membrane protein